jgi:exopolysaccharide production protein ExoZ
MVAGRYVLHADLDPVRTILSYLFLPSYSKDGQIQPLLAVGWTLNFEMLFYFLFSIALLLRTNVYRFVGTILLVLALGAYFRTPSWPAAAFYMNSIVLEFLFGMLIAKACMENRKLPPKIAVAILISALLLLPFDASISSSYLPTVLRYGLPAAMLVWAVASLEKFLIHTPRALLFFADASYAIYLFHPLVAPLAPASLAKLHLIYPRLSVVLSLTLAFSAGGFIHWFLERPLNHWLRDNLRVRHHRVVAAM